MSINHKVCDTDVCGLWAKPGTVHLFHVCDKNIHGKDKNIFEPKQASVDVKEMFVKCCKNPFQR